jgi:antitoxin Phd
LRKKKSRPGVSVSSTEAQNNFGDILDRVSSEGRIFITRYRKPQAVVLSIREYEALTDVEPVDLEALEAEFDSALAAMQSAEQTAGVDALFGSTSAELGAAALEAARKDAADRRE